MKYFSSRKDKTKSTIQWKSLEYHPNYFSLLHQKSFSPIFSRDNTHFSEGLFPMSGTFAEMTKLILPQHANPLGITFGGQILQWMEQLASISATKLLQTLPYPVCLLTLSMDSVSFLKPSKVGSILHLKSLVTRVFNTSLEVHVSVELYNVNICSTDTPHHDAEDVITNDAWISFMILEAPVPSKALPAHTRSSSSLPVAVTSEFDTLLNTFDLIPNGMSSQGVGKLARLRFPTKIPQVVPSTVEERLLSQGADIRKQARLLSKAYSLKILD